MSKKGRVLSSDEAKRRADKADAGEDVTFNEDESREQETSEQKALKREQAQRIESTIQRMKQDKDFKWVANYLTKGQESLVEGAGWEMKGVYPRKNNPNDVDTIGVSTKSYDAEGKVKLRPKPYLVYNPEFLAPMSDAEMITVLMHEAGHITNGDTTLEGNLDDKGNIKNGQWQNLAGDLVINRRLKARGLVFPKDEDGKFIGVFHDDVSNESTGGDTVAKWLEADGLAVKNNNMDSNEFYKLFEKHATPPTPPKQKDSCPKCKKGDGSQWGKVPAPKDEWGNEFEWECDNCGWKVPRPQKIPPGGRPGKPPTHKLPPYKQPPTPPQKGGTKQPPTPPKKGGTPQPGNEKNHGPTKEEWEKIREAAKKKAEKEKAKKGKDAKFKITGKKGKGLTQAEKDAIKKAQDAKARAQRENKKINNIVDKAKKPKKTLGESLSPEEGGGRELDWGKAPPAMKLDWGKVLKQYAQEASDKSTQKGYMSYKKRHSRTRAYGYPIPTRSQFHKDTQPMDIVLGVDTSWSIDRATLKIIAKELDGLKEQFPNVKTYLVSWNGRVDNVVEIKGGSISPRFIEKDGSLRTDGGGTNIAGFYDWLENPESRVPKTSYNATNLEKGWLNEDRVKRFKPKIIINFTDGEAYGNPMSKKALGKAKLLHITESDVGSFHENGFNTGDFLQYKQFTREDGTDGADIIQMILKKGKGLEHEYKRLGLEDSSYKPFGMKTKVDSVEKQKGNKKYKPKRVRLV